MAVIEHIVRDLEKFRRAHGLTQSELASRLGVSQAHISRVISGSTAPSNKLTFRIKNLLSKSAPRDVSKWLGQVEHAAASSDAFKVLVDSALKILNRR